MDTNTRHATPQGSGRVYAHQVVEGDRVVWGRRAVTITGKAVSTDGTRVTLSNDKGERHEFGRTAQLMRLPARHTVAA